MNIGMNAAVLGLLANQRALDVASHNVANANTPGYSRQRIDMSATAPQGAGGFHSRWQGPGNVGTGVAIDQIKRVRDQFIDRQVREESSPLGEAQVSLDTMTQIEDIFGEPSENSLNSLMTRHWDAWHSLSTNPENMAVRTNLREVGVQLASVFQTLHGKLTDLRQDLNDRIATTVNDINSTTRQIADLNREIASVLASGQNPNDLQDQRDLLLEGLSEKVDIHVSEVPSTGALNVYIGGQPLVSNSDAFPLAAVPRLINGFFEVQYPKTGDQAQINGGSLKALLDARNVTMSDTTPGGFIYELNQLAQGVMASVNAAHSTGFGLDGTTGLNFFVGTDASDMEVEPAIALISDGTILIAAAANDPGSLAGGPGDNGNALKIAQMRNQLLMSGGTTTIDDYYKGILTQAGVQGQEAGRRLATQESLVASVKERREQVSGVSTDEEMANVIRFQKAYAASARVLTAIDEMLEVLINVGR